MYLFLEGKISLLGNFHSSFGFDRPFTPGRPQICTGILQFYAYSTLFRGQFQPGQTGGQADIGLVALLLACIIWSLIRLGISYWPAAEFTSHPQWEGLFLRTLHTFAPHHLNYWQLKSEKLLLFGLPAHLGPWATPGLTVFGHTSAYLQKPVMTEADLHEGETSNLKKRNYYSLSLISEKDHSCLNVPWSPCCFLKQWIGTEPRQAYGWKTPYTHTWCHTYTPAFNPDHEKLHSPPLCFQTVLSSLSDPVSGLSQPASVAYRCLERTPSAVVWWNSCFTQHYSYTTDFWKERWVLFQGRD